MLLAPGRRAFRFKRTKSIGPLPLTLAQQDYTSPGAMRCIDRDVQSSVQNHWLPTLIANIADPSRNKPLHKANFEWKLAPLHSPVIHPETFAVRIMQV